MFLLTIGLIIIAFYSVNVCKIIGHLKTSLFMNTVLILMWLGATVVFMIYMIEYIEGIRRFFAFIIYLMCAYGVRKGINKTY